MAANIAAFQAGWNYGETTEAFSVRYEVKPAPLDAGHVPEHHRQHRAGLRPGGRVAAGPGCRCSSAPTRSRPASDILHELSKHKRFGVRTFQAEDEIAGVGAALGASFGGALGRHHHLRARHAAQGRDHRPGRLGRAAADHLRHPAGRPVHRHADQDRAGRPAAWRCTAGTASRRSRSSRPPARRTASTRRSRRPGSRSSTGPRCSCSPTATSPTAPSRGASRTSPTCPT